MGALRASCRSKSFEVSAIVRRPRGTPVAVKPAMATYDGPSAEATARILVVDDSALARAVVGRGLKVAGMQVDEARCGAEALQLLMANRYDVVISDLCMPGVDGFALLASIKMESPGTEVIILSGVEDVERAMHALKLGAHAFLAKPPAHPKEVLLTVRRALEMKRLRDLYAFLQQELQNAEQRGVPGMSPRRASPARQAAAG